MPHYTKIKAPLQFSPTNYPSDLRDEEWKIIEHLYPYGNQSEWNKRSLINAVFYINKTGCQWRMLPNDFPPHDTVWSFFRRAKINGLWETMNDLLVEKTREKANREKSPTYALIDSQSVKTTSSNKDSYK